MSPHHRLLTYCRRLRLKLAGVEVGRGGMLGAHLRVSRGVRAGQPGRLAIGDDCWLETGAVLEAWGGQISLGPRVFVGPYAVIYGHGGVTIGEDTLVSMHCRILSSDHAMPPPDRRIRWEPDVLKPTHIGHDVWLGAGVTVLGGVTIGDGCVIGAGAVVTRDLPPNSIALGVPARVTGSRQR